MRSVMAVSVLAAVCSSAVAAQENAVPLGARVRVTTERSRLVGTLDSVGSDYLVLAADRHSPSEQFSSHSPSIELPLRSIVRMEMSRGRRSRVLQGAGIGALAGVGVSVVFLVGFCGDPDTACQADEWARAFAVFVPPGAVLGAVIGALSKGDERWQQVPMSRFRVGVLPTLEGGIVLGGSIGF